MIYISFKNYKKLYEAEKQYSNDRVKDIQDLRQTNRNLNSRIIRLVSELDVANKAFSKANEILTRHKKQPRDEKGRFTKQKKD